MREQSTKNQGSKTGGLTGGLRGGLEKSNILIIRRLANKTGGLGER